MNKTILAARTESLTAAREHLAFLDHEHEFDALQGGPGRAKGFESEHRSDDPFDGAVILLDQVVQILDLADSDLLAWPISSLSASMAAVLTPHLVDHD